MSNKNTNIVEIPVCGFRKLEDPFVTKYNKYFTYVHVKDIPADLPMMTNPREQNLNTDVAKAIKNSLTSGEQQFHKRNRGILLSVDSIHFNNKTDKMTLVFKDLNVHGNIDGGHTYKIILDELSKNKTIDEYVQVEIMEGVEDQMDLLAEARNTSVEVSEQSLAELRDQFDPIKDSIGGLPMYERVAFKQFEKRDEFPVYRIIDAREIVAVLTMFNKDKYSNIKHPTVAYSSKASVLTAYLQSNAVFEKMHNIAPDIFDLYTEIEMTLPSAYNNEGGKYGALSYSGYNDGNPVAKTRFNDHDLRYKVPVGLIYPILGAFRSILKEDENGMYEWRKDPFETYDTLKNELAKKAINYMSSIGGNPTVGGKEATLWDVMYMTVERSLINI
ncbi:AIPR family protein [Marinilactibacillus sp. Marseille-P9653]|uniref:AIPR family protein n=1 Tax=Marinilactibacillus sp. Marseille-P9653 TaxID=2866583 RepID=UPI001CE43B53|nr:AIPR family protein [Marinilactibacillus sp. Marseille-P9653]